MASDIEMFLEELTGMDMIRDILLVELQELQASVQKMHTKYFNSDGQFCDLPSKKTEAVRETNKETKVLKELEKMSIRVASLEKTCADQK